MNRRSILKWLAATPLAPLAKWFAPKERGEPSLVRYRTGIAFVQSNQEHGAAVCVRYTFGTDGVGWALAESLVSVSDGKAVLLDCSRRPWRIVAAEC